jgi:hypothetical protein
VAAYNGLLNDEFARAWGEPGIPGDEHEIVGTCRLCAEVCQSTVAWEEEVRFLSVHEIFRALQSHLAGAAGRLLEEALKVPTFLSDTLSQKDLAGTHTLNLTVSLPDGWGEAWKQELETAMAAMISDAGQ